MAKRRTGAHVNGLVVAAVAVSLLGGCGLIMGEDLDGLMIPVTNNTDQDLSIRSGGGAARGDVEAGSTATVEFARVECTRNVNATTADMDLAVERPGVICEGDSWAIEQDDLRPYREVFPVLIDVVNDTRQGLTIRSDGKTLGYVEPEALVTVDLLDIECGDQLVAVSEDESLVALPSDDLCSGGRWVISGDDLEPNGQGTPPDD